MAVLLAVAVAMTAALAEALPTSVSTPSVLLNLPCSTPISAARLSQVPIPSLPGAVQEDCEMESSLTIQHISTYCI